VYVEVERQAAKLEPFLDAVACDVGIELEGNPHRERGVGAMDGDLVSEPACVERRAATRRRAPHLGDRSRTVQRGGQGRGRLAQGHGDPSSVVVGASDRSRSASCGGGSAARVATISLAQRRPPSTWRHSCDTFHPGQDGTGTVTSASSR
jgi:hypothetical protein